MLGEYMKNLFLACCLALPSLTASALTGSVAVSQGDGVRIRVKPGINEKTIGGLRNSEEVFAIQVTSFTQSIDGRENRWYKVINFDGKIGWTFGGYLKVLTTEQELPSTVTSLSLIGKPESIALNKGKLIRVSVTNQVKNNYSELENMDIIFVQEPNRGQYILDYWPVGSGDCGGSQVIIDRVANMQGDAREEIAIRHDVSGEDGGQENYLIYGSTTPFGKYRLLTSIPLNGGGAGALCGETSTHVIEGPVSSISNAKAEMKMKKRIYRQFEDGKDSRGYPICANETFDQEETYQWNSGELVLTDLKKVPFGGNEP